MAPAAVRGQTAGVRNYRRGDRGPEIVDIQHRLSDLGFLLPGDEPAGTFDAGTVEAVRAFQAHRNLRVDGIVGPDTWGQLVEAGYRLGDRTLYVHAPMLRGDDVRALQRKLDALGFDPGKQDGYYGPDTDAAVREFQRNVGDDADGIVGLHTISSIERMRPLDDVPGRGVVRETEELLAIHGALTDRVIAIDPGEERAGVTMALARSLAVELAHLGADTVVLTGGGAPDPTSCAAEANAIGAAICVSLHRRDVGPEPNGPTCSYFGSRTTYSPAGRRLAERILEELEHELRARGRLQRLSIAVLRDTQMAAVQVEAFPDDLVPAETPLERDATTRLGRAIAEGVRRFFED